MADTPDLSRRRFLQTSALVAGSAALAPVPSWAAKPAVSRVRRVGAGPSLKGRWILPGDEAYEMAAFPNNARYAGTRPAAIAVCADDQDVQKSINWARDNNMSFAIRSGGHNYAGFSTTTGLLIDVKPMNSVTVDWANRRVVVNGGASNEDVANALRSIPFAVPSGRCPTVGTSGLVLGGGWGFAATHSGLTCDSLVETDIVLASGNKVTANAKNSLSDLFWAIRGGGGGNFGVHTSFTFNLVPVTDVTTFNIVWSGGPENQVKLMTSLQKMQTDPVNERKISTRSKVRPTRAVRSVKEDPLKRHELIVETLGLYWGTEKQLREVLADTFFIQAPAIADIRERPYWDARDYLVTDDPHGMYDLKSSYVETSLSEDALNTMLTWMTKWPGGSLRQDNLGILFAIGGAVKDKNPGDTAYVHRKSNYIFEMERAWAPIDKDSVLDAQAAWLSDYYEDMMKKKYLQPEAYVNFPNRDLKDWATQYYGSNLRRLKEVKSKYDPGEIFKFKQSIPLANTP